MLELLLIIILLPIAIIAALVTAWLGSLVWRFLLAGSVYILAAAVYLYDLGSPKSYLWQLITLIMSGSIIWAWATIKLGEEHKTEKSD